ncbi:MAG: hypothetical protein RQ875_13915 [Vicingaceae bacterium]|nr:hypothetical protein [Vicingaceae bacterium]
MITPKIKALFQFIEFLHSNIDHYKQYDKQVTELENLFYERNRLGISKNYKEKLRHDKIQVEIPEKYKVIEVKIIQPLKDKINELKICDLNDTNTLWNWNISEISDLKENFSKDDIPEIISHNNKYIEFRTKTNKPYFEVCLFNDLDETLKDLFSYFNENTQTDFKAFEAKQIVVNDDLSNTLEVAKALKAQYHYGNQRFAIDENKFEQLPELIKIKKSLVTGFCIMNKEKKYKVYNAQLSLILNTKDLPDINGKTFDGSRYIDDFINGYEKGIAYFNKNYSIDRNALYNNPEHYLKELHQLCFHTKIENGAYKGWYNFVSYNYPLTVDNMIIEKYGYYSGLVSTVESLAEKHDLLFNDFGLLCDECKVRFGKKETSTPQPDKKRKPEQIETEHSEKIKKLKSIWLAEPKLTVEDFLQKGKDKGFWNDNLELTLQRNSSTYGTGKTFLGNVFIAFKGWAIPEHFDYKEAGSVFCKVFNIEVKESTKEKYKLFCTSNQKQVKEIKRTFGVENS